MAKDPAFLFYSSDFLTGTILMSNEEIGIYIKLLCIQHQKGVIPKKDMLIICSTHVGVIEKFATDENGDFYNVRLSQEVEKRLIYSESRRNNRKGNKDMLNICKSYVPHMENENENENENIVVIKEGVVGETIEKPETNQVAKIPPDLKYVQEYFNIKGELDQAERFYDYYTSNGWKVGKNKMKCWKSAVRNWISKSKEFKKDANTTNPNDERIAGRLTKGQVEEFINRPSDLKF